MKTSMCYHCFQEKQTPEGPCPSCGYDSAGMKEKFPLALGEGSILNGRYIIGHPLGQGGFGITYVAQDVQSNTRVAIKEFFPETMATRTEGHSVTAFTGERQSNFQYGLQCFLSEAQTMAQFIGVPNVVRIHSYFEENGTAYFVMDYVDGISLQTHLKQQGGKISWEAATELLFPIMDALTTVHSKGIIHRDISPDNICISADGTVKLLDFGAARYSLGDRSRSLDVVLKAGYAPKEQYTRRGRQGPYTDVYSMAATLYYAITGRLPPESVDRDEEDELILPSSFGVRLPSWAEDALEKGLAIRSADRYQTMAEFRGALSGKTSFTQPLPPPEPVPLPAAKPEPPSAAPTPQVRNSAVSKRLFLINTAAGHPKRISIIAIAAVILGCLGVFWLFPTLKYNQARKDLQNKHFDSAYSAFRELGSFRDSKAMATQAQYQLANRFLEEKQYDKAHQMFLKLGAYEDSQKLASQSLYQKAEKLLQEGSYDEALAIFQDLGNYGDSGEKTKETLYEKALALQDQKDFQSAYQLFQELKNYHDSKAKTDSCVYAWVDYILENSSGTEAKVFKDTATVTSSQYSTIYEKVLRKINTYDTYADWGIDSFIKLQNKSDVVRTLLETLPSTYKECEKLQRLFRDLAYGTMHTAKTYIAQNGDFLESVWKYALVQDYLTNENNFEYFLVGNWTTDNNSHYIKFTENADGSMHCNYTLPGVPKPAGTKYYNIKNTLYIFTDANSKELAKVFRFTVQDFNTISVYCYQNSQTYRLSRTR